MIRFGTIGSSSAVARAQMVSVKTAGERPIEATRVGFKGESGFSESGESIMLSNKRMQNVKVKLNSGYRFPALPSDSIDPLICQEIRRRLTSVKKPKLHHLFGGSFPNRNFRLSVCFFRKRRPRSRFSLQKLRFLRSEFGFQKGKFHSAGRCRLKTSTAVKK